MGQVLIVAVLFQCRGSAFNGLSSIRIPSIELAGSGNIKLNQLLQYFLRISQPYSEI